MDKAPHKLKFAIIATDTVLFTVEGRELKALLMRVRRPPHYINHWGAPGGLIHPKENADEAARRHLWIKGGVRNVYLEQLYTFSRVDRDPRGRVVSVAYLALTPDGGLRTKTKEEVKWFPVNKLPRMAYDHKEIIARAVRRLKAKLGYTNIAFALLPDEFTLSELQRIYEVVLERKLDKRNFRKKFFALKLLTALEKKKRGGANRPAGLYRFAEKKLKIVEVL